MTYNDRRNTHILVGRENEKRTSLDIPARYLGRQVASLPNMLDLVGVFGELRTATGDIYGMAKKEVIIKRWVDDCLGEGTLLSTEEHRVWYVPRMLSPSSSYHTTAASHSSTECYADGSRGRIVPDGTCDGAPPWVLTPYSTIAETAGKHGPGKDWHRREQPSPGVAQLTFAQTPAAEHRQNKRPRDTSIVGLPSSLAVSKAMSESAERAAMDGRYDKLEEDPEQTSHPGSYELGLDGDDDIDGSMLEEVSQHEAQSDCSARATKKARMEHSDVALSSSSDQTRATMEGRGNVDIAEGVFTNFGLASTFYVPAGMSNRSSIELLIEVSSPNHHYPVDMADPEGYRWRIDSRPRICHVYRPRHTSGGVSSASRSRRDYDCPTFG